MFDAVAEFISMQQGDSAEFIETARAIAIGVAQDYEPARLYVIRIDNWFGPKWMHFAGKFTVWKTLLLSAFTRRACMYRRLFRIPWWGSEYLWGRIMRDGSCSPAAYRDS